MLRGSWPISIASRSAIAPIDGAGLPFERGFAPAEQAGLVGLDAHENPVAHLRVADPRGDRSDLQTAPPRAQ